jgi:ABC-type transport system substrate-binding protein
VNFDPYFTEGLTGIYGAWLERLVCDDWTMDPAEWNYQLAWHPAKYQKGNLAESLEFPDPATHIVHLRKGIHYPNVPPSNGREFTSEDVMFHYHRIYGLGGGFTKPSPYRDTDIRFKLRRGQEVRGHERLAPCRRHRTVYFEGFRAR